MSSSVDSKLVHLVRKFLSFSVDESPNADHIVHCIRTQHREYQRKDLARLKRQVQKVLKRLTRSQQSTEEGHTNGNNGNVYNGNSSSHGYHKSSSGVSNHDANNQNANDPNDYSNNIAMVVAAASASSKKRSMEQAVEDQPQEKRSRKRESSSQRTVQSIENSVLNAALLERYRLLQQEREEVAAREAAAEPSDVQPAATIPITDGSAPAADSLLALHSNNGGNGRSSGNIVSNGKSDKRDGSNGKSKTSRSSSRRELTTTKKRSHKYAEGETEKDILQAAAAATAKSSSKSLKRKKSSSSKNRSSSTSRTGGAVPIEGAGLPSSSSKNPDSNSAEPMLTCLPVKGSQISSSKKESRKKHSSSSSSKYDSGAAAVTPALELTSSFVPTPVSRPQERYSDLGGMSHIFKQLVPLVEYPLLRPELYIHLGIDPPRGVLLRGPPGCGKTHLANAIAGQLMGMTITAGGSGRSSSRSSSISYFRISGPELVSGISGESEGRIRELFRAASAAAPAIVFMDELDVVAPNRRSDSGQGKGSMEKRMVAQLLNSMDLLDPKHNRNNAPVIVLGATNQLRADSIDPALRRAGRFDKEIMLGVPDEEGRVEMLQAVTKAGTLKLKGDLDFKLLARKTPGYVGADLKSLAKEAAAVAIHRILNAVHEQQNQSEGAQKGGDDDKVQENSQLPMEGSKGQQKLLEGDSLDPNYSHSNNNNSSGDHKDAVVTSMVAFNDSAVIPLTAKQMEPLCVTMNDFLVAIPQVQPSSKREGFATVPDVSWDDIGALTTIREELSLSVLEPIRNPERFKALGIPLPAGVMLYGPPGCGKTLLAKAIANESGANFISVKGPELLDKYVGESERAVRSVFERARSSSPCVVFFDELDSLCPKRGKGDGGGGGVSERVVNQLLTEMDGLESRRSVFVIAATNRPELIDPAMMRPGRLDKLLYVPLPTGEDRVAILKALSVGVQLAPSVDLRKIGTSHRAEGYSGADCAALLREAGLAVLKEDYHARMSNSVAASADAMSLSRKDDNDTGNALPSLCINEIHFDYAFDHVVPSVSKKDQVRYDRMRDRMAHARSRGSVAPEPDDGKDQSEVEGGTANSATVVGAATDGTTQGAPSEDNMKWEQQQQDARNIEVFPSTAAPNPSAASGANSGFGVNAANSMDGVGVSSLNDVDSSNDDEPQVTAI